MSDDPGHPGPSVLKHGVPKTLAFAFSLRLRSKSKMRHSKTCVLGRTRSVGGLTAQARFRFGDLRSKRLAFTKHVAMFSCDLEACFPQARACVHVLRIPKTRRFAVLSPRRQSSEGNSRYSLKSPLCLQQFLLFAAVFRRRAPEKETMGCRHLLQPLAMPYGMKECPQ